MPGIGQQAPARTTTGRAGTHAHAAWLVLPGLLGLTAFYYLA